MSAEYVAELLELLPDSDLPAELVEWLLDGFTRYQDFGEDIAEALGLDQPLIDRRDELLKMCVMMAPSDSMTAKAAFTLACLHHGQTHPDPTAQKFIERLRSLPCRLPHSIRHLARLIDGDRAGRDKTKITVLCPDWATPYDLSTFDETGT